MNSGPQIVSCVWGSADYTTLFSKTITDLIKKDPTSTSFSFYPTIRFFGGTDPNYGVAKACVVVWRNTLPGSTAQNTLYGPFHSSSGLEQWPEGANNGSLVTIQWSPAGETEWSIPPPTHRGQTVFAAYWYNVDKTASAIAELGKYGDTTIPPNPTFLINSTTMNGDPAPAHPYKQFCITYGNWEGDAQWSFRTAVGMGGSDWQLSIPPNTLDVNNRITLANDGCGVAVYPVIVDQDLNIVFDGSTDFQLADGGVRDLDLVAQAGCEERQTVWINWMFPRTMFTAMPRQLFIASSSPAAFPCRYSISSNPSSGSLTTKSQFQYEPRKYTNKDLRVNVYSATWGDQIYTEFVRQQYISSTVYRPPTDSSNFWSFPADTRAFGTEPNPGIQKCLVVIYRIAQVIDTTDGVIFAPDQIDPNSSSYDAEKLRSVNTGQYPVLRDISDFRIATRQQIGPGQVWLTIDLITQAPSLTPWSPPTSAEFSFVKAVWSNADATVYAVNTWDTRQGAVNVNVSPDTTGRDMTTKDPWVGVPKQFTALVSYPLAGVPNAGNIFQYQTYVGLNAAWSWNLTVSLNAPGAVAYSQWPKGFTPDLGPLIKSVQFVNNTNLAVWPCVYQSLDEWLWNGYRADPVQWKIAPNSSVSLDLVHQAGCVPDSMYIVSFHYGGPPNPQLYAPSPGWIRAGMTGSIGPCFSLKLTYTNGTTSSGPGQYMILREFAYVGLG